MDFIKNAINDAGEKAAKDAMVDQASNVLKNALGDGNSKIVDQASSFVKNTIDNQDGSKTHSSSSTTETTFLDQAQNMIKNTVNKQSETTVDGNKVQTTEKTTVKSDYVDKGISIIEEKVFNISADKQNQEQNEKIAGYVRTGIEKITHSNNSKPSNEN